MEVLLGAAIVLGFLFLMGSRGSGLAAIFGGPVSSPSNPGISPNAPPTALGTALPAPTATAGSQLLAQSQAGANQTMQVGIAAGAGLASAGVSVGLGISAGTVSAVAGAATLGIGAIVGIADILWSQHEQRLRDATSENQAWNEIYPSWASTIQAIFAAYNAGTIDAATAAAEVMALRNYVYQDASQYKGVPGVDWTAGNIGPGGTPVGLTGSQRIWPVQCGSGCTIGCCLFNGVCGPQSNRAAAMLQGQPVEFFPAPGQFVMASGKTQFTVGALQANPKYGFNAQPAFTLAMMR